MAIEFPSTKSVKDSIRDVIGQTVTFVVRDDGTACPTCSGLNYYDEVNEASLDPFCITCSGFYWVIADIDYSIVAHVRWRTQDQPNMDIAGSTLEGDCAITIDINDISESNIVKIRHIVADSRKLQVYRAIYRGVPTRDRIRFICREWSRD